MGLQRYAQWAAAADCVFSLASSTVCLLFELASAAANTFVSVSGHENIAETLKADLTHRKEKFPLDFFPEVCVHVRVCACACVCSCCSDCEHMQYALEPA